jgi:hypothetical protein
MALRSILTGPWSYSDAAVFNARIMLTYKLCVGNEAGSITGLPVGSGSEKFSDTFAEPSRSTW